MEIGSIFAEPCREGRGDACGGCWVLSVNSLIFGLFCLSLVSSNRDRQSVGRRYVEITPGSRADYYEAIAAVCQAKSSNGNGGSICGAHHLPLCVCMFIFMITAANEGAAAAAFFE
jgi:hypothetical protein